jgi:hypothetical protein
LEYRYIITGMDIPNVYLSMKVYAKISSEENIMKNENNDFLNKLALLCNFGSSYNPNKKHVVITILSVFTVGLNLNPSIKWLILYIFMLGMYMDAKKETL